MIALLTTYLIVAYILMPGVLFRVSASGFIQLRLYQLSKTEEATVGCLVALLPFLFALLCVWQVPGPRHYPFPDPRSDFIPYRAVYRHAFTVVTAENPAALLEGTDGKRTVYEESLLNIAYRQMRFLAWYYVFIVGEGLFFGYFASKYGDWLDKPKREMIIRNFMLPRISEWQLLLTDFAFSKKEKRAILADVLCTDHLYRGSVADYYLDKKGDLSGILLKKVDRFRKQEYDEARIAASPDNPLDKEKFWRKIPGANFYIPAAQITNLNIRFPYESSTDLLNYLTNVFQDVARNATITVEQEQQEQNPSHSSAEEKPSES